MQLTRLTPRRDSQLDQTQDQNRWEHSDPPGKRLDQSCDLTDASELREEAEL